MRQTPRAGTLLLPFATLALVLASDAGARKFQMTGSWEMRRGGAFFEPLQHGSLIFSPPVWATMGLGTPNGPVPGMGGVSAMGSGPPSLTVPPGRFGGAFQAGLPLGEAQLLQVVTMFTAAGPAVQALLAPEGGPGSFSWCPGDPGCVGGGTPEGRRVVYRAGPNRFGGVMRMLLAGRLTVSLQGGGSLPWPASQVAHAFLSSQGVQHTGATYAFMSAFQPAAGFLTRPFAFPPPGKLLTAPGPKVTTMGGLTDTATGPTLTFPRSGASFTGFPFTTGTVLVQQATVGGYNTFFTVMGTDARTPLGAGNITLVAGGLARQGSNFTDGPSFGRVRMTLAAPVPSVSAQGIATAALLVLLAVGYTLRSRA